ncbi:MAG: hypothetical protein CMM30_00280 [Rhodospirillaceae bacterium]|nr:hypothetical protein [Rhodospirillaceae bacterium]|tara:strand:+ start:17745 stop:18674 length:930 start_codon:yes stop_codon:yes gene_type:complete
MTQKNPEIEILLKRVADANLPSIETYDPAEARVEFRRRMRVLETDHEPIYKVEDLTIGLDKDKLLCRLYQHSENTNAPLIVFAHGGGWVLAGLEEYDNFCRRLSSAGSCNVLSVEYRLAPEHPYPAALNDMILAFSSLDQVIFQHNLQPSSIIGVGDSAGGNLIASTSIKIPKEKKPKGQILIYPVLDTSMKRNSYSEFGSKFLLDTAVMDWFIQSYCSETSKDDPNISIILSPNLSRSPQTYIMTAGLDPLRDEGFEFVEKLRELSISVTHSHYSDMLHGFLGMPKALNTYKDAFNEVGKWIRKIDKC